MLKILERLIRFWPRLIGLLLILLLFLGIFFFRSIHSVEKYSATYLDAFDTVTEIILYCENEEEFERISGLLHERMMEYHQYYDIYHTYPDMVNIKTINNRAGKGPVEVEAEVMDLLLYAKQLYEVTHGQVNVAMGSVLQAWHHYRTEGTQVPAIHFLREKAAHTSIDNLILNPKEMTVELLDKEMSLDVGSVAKGYAAQQLAEYAKELGVKHGLFSLGGNIVTIGSKPDRSHWTIGIQNPASAKNPQSNANAYITDVSVSGKSVVTSGDYQRYYTVDGVEYCHIIDPDTLMPGDYFSSVTVIGEDSGMADALSTALFNMSLQDGRALMREYSDYSVIWIDKDGNVIYSENYAY